MLGFLLAGGIANAYRFEKPQKITRFDEGSMAAINKTFEQMWDFANGRFTIDVVTSVPTAAAHEGDIKVYYSGSTYRIYIYIDGVWRYAALTS